MSPSPYRPIDTTSGEIRLLVLQPHRKHESGIQCGLKSVLFSTNPKYEALSYTWGNEANAEEILINGTPFRIRENAAAALRRLRYALKRRVLWIDAICINQEDTSERAEQVLLMRRIYSQAEQVCIWLGEHTDGSFLGMMHLKDEFVQEGFHRSFIDEKYGKPWPRHRALGWTKAEEVHDDFRDGEVREILCRPWWRRTWIVQEAVLARKLVIMCGSDTVDWSAVTKFFNEFKSQMSRPREFDVPLKQRDEFPDYTYKSISRFRERLSSTMGQVHLLEAMYTFRYLECTDARDRIYGFLGLDPEASKRIKPDYKSPIVEVYWDFARTIIETTGLLDVLNCRREWENTETRSHPLQSYSFLDQSRYHDPHASILLRNSTKPRRGWIRLPDGWERIPGEQALYKDHNSNQTTDKSPLEGQPPRLMEDILRQRELPPGWSKTWDNAGRVSVLYGNKPSVEDEKILLDRMTLKKDLLRLPSWVPNWECPTDRDPAPLIDRALPHEQYWASGTTTASLHKSSPEVLSLDGLIVDEIQQLSEPWHPQVDRPPISRKGIETLISWEALGKTYVNVENSPYKTHDALWRTMIADYAGDKAAPDDDCWYVEVWYDRIGWGMTWDELDNYFAAGHKDWPYLSSKMKKHFWKFLIEQPWSALTEVFRVERKYGEYIHRIYKACAHRALFLTKKGYVGLAPWNAKVGDKVAILCGGQTPSLLRETDEAGNYKLVGETYVYGLMAGERLVDEAGEKRPLQVIHIS